MRWALPVLMLAACGPISAERAADRCEEKAQAAQGPTGRITIGTNSRTGGFVDGEVGISLNAVRGDDPVQVYERCVFGLTGQAPIRPPVLRNR